MNDELLTKVDELVDIIISSELYKKYQEIEKKLMANDEIMNLIEMIKKDQKQLVLLESKNIDTSSLEKTYQQALEKLQSFPLYIEFYETQKELNEKFTLIHDTIEPYFDFKDF